MSTNIDYVAGAGRGALSPLAVTQSLAIWMAFAAMLFGLSAGSFVWMSKKKCRTSCCNRNCCSSFGTRGASVLLGAATGAAWSLTGAAWSLTGAAAAVGGNAYRPTLCKCPAKPPYRPTSANPSRRSNLKSVPSLPPKDSDLVFPSFPTILNSIRSTTAPERPHTSLILSFSTSILKRLGVGWFPGGRCAGPSRGVHESSSHTR
mmetsp:Transcript_51691/g.126093  ORF Transcript_51691/g.126093 Transcript_51691/m.126093 type:complete len:204 (+) Transcript_51691:269-880(+)